MHSRLMTNNVTYGPWFSIIQGDLWDTQKRPGDAYLPDSLGVRHPAGGGDVSFGALFLLNSRKSGHIR